MNNPFETLDKRLSNIENLLLDIKHTPQQEDKPSQSEELLTRKKAKEYLGISDATLWRYEKSGTIRAYGIGGKRYFKRFELEQSLISKK